eukprot:TRINITY_DN1393_c0_g1_i3.p4 TRINITY_DN1393_c0_g1~~TRINITY_DN1393_c0_g1_i3.p4  ORF type:complete len:103 (-),score=7.40 TRINITY_DN1393_c0_g1_i3:74-382(-)
MHMPHMHQLFAWIFAPFIQSKGTHAFHVGHDPQSALYFQKNGTNSGEDYEGRNISSGDILNDNSDEEYPVSSQKSDHLETQTTSGDATLLNYASLRYQNLPA